MPFNKTNIGWCTHTYNPVTGCLGNCGYCYARGIARRFGGKSGANQIDYAHVYNQEPLYELLEPKHGDPYPWGFAPTLHEYRLNDPVQHKKPTRVFVGSMCDLFGPWVPDAWIEAVFAACAAAPQHQYLFLTKYPERYIKLAEAGKLPTQHWYGTTITNQETFYFFSMRHKTFLSIEPLLGPFEASMSGGQRVFSVDWVIIGAMTGPNANKNKPERAWIEEICAGADAMGVPVFMKESLKPIVGEGGMRREYPAGMQ